MRWRHLGVAAVVLALAACGDGARPDAETPDTEDAPAVAAPSQPATPEPPTSEPTATTTEFASSVAPTTAQELAGSWTEGIGCAPPEDLALVTVRHHGFDGAVHDGRIVVASAVADDVVAVFADLFAAGFPIESMRPVSAFDGDDDASMAANNSSGYNCRTVAGTSTLSQHAFGLAIDINPLMNPWLHDGMVDPPEGAHYADRSRTDPGTIHAGDVVVQAFAARGWSWGGDWTEPDYQHFYIDG